jgi:tRNA-dependent cyclodipeptide synthase
MNDLPHSRDPYKIILRHANGWQKFEAARLQISVPLKPTFDPRTRCIIDWAVKHFYQVTLCLHDSIQRYNLLALGASEKEAEAHAIKNGDIWLSKNIFPSDVFVDVVRWREITAAPNFSQIYDRVLSLYNNNEMGFSSAIDYDTNVFADRCRRRGEEYSEERLILSRNFLLEEVAGYIPLFQATSAVDIHTGMRMKAMQIVLNGAGNFKLQKNLMVAIKTYIANDQEPTIISALKSARP